MEGIRGYWFNKLIIVGLVFLLIFGAGITTINVWANQDEKIRTGNLGNQPQTGFSEGNETIRFYNDTGVHKTVFEPNENITINISSDFVNLAPPPVQNKKNQISVLDYFGNTILDLQDAAAFTQLPGGPPYIYTANFTAPATDDHYLVQVQLREPDIPGRDQFTTADVIQVGNGSMPLKNMTTYSEAAFITPDWTFSTGDTIYIKVYTPNTIDPTDSDIKFADYKGNEAVISIEDLDNYTIIEQGNDSIISFNLLNDLDWSAFPDEQLMGNYWYTISVDLKDLTGTQMASDWTAQIRIVPPPIISETVCNPTPIYAKGTNTTTLWTLFSDENTTGVSNFSVTLKVRDPNDGITTLVANETHGNNNLTIVSLGNNTYNASFIWDPPEDALLGEYDLYAMVYDNENGVDIDDFENNQNELTLLKLGEFPTINASNTTCDPEKVNIMNNEIVTFTANFSDLNDPPLPMNEFFITFKIRDKNDNEIIIAGNKKDGEKGDVSGSDHVEIDNYEPGLYSASIAWNPDLGTVEGKYDLYFRVTNSYGTAMDDFDNNIDELEVYSTGQPPQLSVGDTTCVPKSLDIIAEKSTMIYCEFMDPDNPPAEVFNVSFKIRPPSDKMNEVITIVENKPNGGSGEFGGEVKIEISGSKYVASYTWTPPLWFDLGFYDLFFMVRDEWNNTAEDPFAQNEDELELISSVTPPNIAVGNTICIPSSVNKIGNGTTKLYCEFTDSNYNNITDFNITFKLRAPDRSEIVLVDNKPVGGSGEDPEQLRKVEITYSGTVFTASYEWDPPLDVVAGKYDLYFGVQNSGKGYARDRFGNNLKELEIVTTGNFPKIIKTECNPEKIMVNKTEKTTLSANFTDIDLPTVENFTVTFKVRDPNGNVIVLVNNKGNNETGEFGDLLEIKETIGGYSASIVWDPNSTVIAGKYDLFSSVKDELQLEAIDGFDNNPNELELVGDIIQPGKPNLEPEITTNDGKNYLFSVIYSDPDGDAPDTNGVILYIGQLSYIMIEEDTADRNYSDGKKYYYTKVLEEGLFEYHFKVTNEKNQTFETEKMTITVEPDDKDEKKDDTGFIVIGIVVIFLILIMLLFLFMLMKPKKSEPEDEKEETSAPRAEIVTDHEPGEPTAPMAQTVEEPISEPEEPEQTTAEEEIIDEEAETDFDKEEQPHVADEVESVEPDLSKEPDDQTVSTDEKPDQESTSEPEPEKTEDIEVENAKESNVEHSPAPTPESANGTNGSNEHRTQTDAEAEQPNSKDSTA